MSQRRARMTLSADAEVDLTLSLQTTWTCLTALTTLTVIPQSLIRAQILQQSTILTSNLLLFWNLLAKWRPSSDSSLPRASPWRGPATTRPSSVLRVRLPPELSFLVKNSHSPSPRMVSPTLAAGDPIKPASTADQPPLACVRHRPLAE